MTARSGRAYHERVSAAEKPALNATDTYKREILGERVTREFGDPELRANAA
jgi:hypothetical protein